MDKITQKISRVLEVFLIILMAVMVLDVTWQVFTRFVLKDPSSFTEELAGFLLIWIGLLGGSYAVYSKAHLGIDMLLRKLEGTARDRLVMIINTFVLLFSFFILVVGGLRLVNLTFKLQQISPAMGLPMGYVYIVLPLTGVLMIYYSIFHLLKAARHQDEGPEKDLPVTALD